METENQKLKGHIDKVESTSENEKISRGREIISADSKSPKVQISQPSVKRLKLMNNIES